MNEIRQNEPLISIIVPCYNVEKYLQKCVDSILNQTYRNLEVILVDDGSTDSTPQMCDEYQKRDERVKVIHKVNGGLADARNVAIDCFKGEYVTFIDSDDYVALDLVETLFGLIVQNNADMSVMWANMFYEGTEPIEDKKEHAIRVFNSEESLIDMFYQRSFDTSAWGKLYHKVVFQDGIRYPKGWIYEDLPTTYRLMQKAKRVVFTDKKSYYYLLRNNSIEGAPFNSKKYESCIMIVDQLEKDYPQMSPAVQKALDCRIVSFLFHILLAVPEKEKEMKATLLKGIKSRRRKVLFDSKARKKARAACLLSYGGLPLVNLFSKYGVSRTH